MVLSEHPTHHIRCAWKKKTTEKKPFKCSWWPEKKFLLALKFSAEKILPKNWKRNQSSHTQFYPYSYHVLQCTTNAYLVRSIALINMVKWHNSELKLINICWRSSEYYSMTFPLPSANNCFNTITLVLSNSIINSVNKENIAHILLQLYWLPISRCQQAVLRGLFF